MVPSGWDGATSDRHRDDRSHGYVASSKPDFIGGINESLVAHAAHRQPPASFVAAPVFAQGSYKKEIPDALAKKAKVTEDVASKAAMARVPKGEIQTVELEEEKGKLIYSYDIKVAGQVRHRRSGR